MWGEGLEKKTQPEMFTRKMDSPKQRSSVFDEPSAKTDVTLAVEGRRLHVNRAVLAAASDVFDKMFNGHFKEKQNPEVPLPGKTFADIVDMLLCIYPSELRSVTEATVDKMLELADEYQIASLKRKCEEFLLTFCQRAAQGVILHGLYLADKYGLPELKDLTIGTAKEYRLRPYRHYFYLEDKNDFVNLGKDTKLELMAQMISHLENKTETPPYAKGGIFYAR